MNISSVLNFNRVYNFGTNKKNATNPLKLQQLNCDTVSFKGNSNIHFEWIEDDGIREQVKNLLREGDNKGGKKPSMKVKDIAKILEYFGYKHVKGDCNGDDEHYRLEGYDTRSFILTASTDAKTSYIGDLANALRMIDLNNGELMPGLNHSPNADELENFRKTTAKYHPETAHPYRRNFEEHKKAEAARKEESIKRAKLKTEKEAEMEYAELCHQREELSNKLENCINDFDTLIGNLLTGYEDDNKILTMTLDNLISEIICLQDRVNEYYQHHINPPTDFKDSINFLLKEVQNLKTEVENYNSDISTKAYNKLEKYAEKIKKYRSIKDTKTSRPKDDIIDLGQTIKIKIPNDISELEKFIAQSSDELKPKADEIKNKIKINRQKYEELLNEFNQRQDYAVKTMCNPKWEKAKERMKKQ